MWTLTFCFASLDFFLNWKLNLYHCYRFFCMIKELKVYFYAYNCKVCTFIMLYEPSAASSVEGKITGYVWLRGFTWIRQNKKLKISWIFFLCLMSFLCLSKIIWKKYKNILFLMHSRMKNILKSNRHHTLKHNLKHTKAMLQCALIAWFV